MCVLLFLLKNSSPCKELTFFQCRSKVIQPYISSMQMQSDHSCRKFEVYFPNSKKWSMRSITLDKFTVCPRCMTPHPKSDIVPLPFHYTLITSWLGENIVLLWVRHRCCIVFMQQQYVLIHDMKCAACANALP